MFFTAILMFLWHVILNNETPHVGSFVSTKSHFSYNVKIGWKAAIEWRWEVYYSTQNPVQLINSHIDSFREAKI